LNAPGIFQNILPVNSFPVTSRYYGIEIATLDTPAGQSIAYVRRRIVPPAENFTLLMEHTVVQGDRLDNVTAKYLGDPEQFWRIADANDAIRPEELTEQIGSMLRITLPEGIPGQPHA
jgi:hypothetical protein